MITLGKFDFNYIYPLICFGKQKITLETKYQTFKVKVSSARLECFRRNNKCVTCNHYGSVLLLQSHIIGSRQTNIICSINDCEWCGLEYYKKQEPGTIDTPHLNMFHVGPRGGLVLMTKDHIIPRSKGGPDTIDNLQTMCTVCNGHKGAHSFEAFAANGFCRMPKTILA